MILYRLGYVVGRTMPGLDVQDVLAAVDYLLSRSTSIRRASLWQASVRVDDGIVCRSSSIGVLSLRASETIFQARDHCWQEPVDRRLPGQLLEFGDAESGRPYRPRPLIVVPDRLHLAIARLF